VNAKRRNDVSIIRVGDITAHCPDCGGTLFRRLSAAGEGGDTPETIYRCLACQKNVSRIELVNQIGDEAMRQARSALTRLGSKRPKTNKPGAG
jgi:DNA-directed RNA polymerase subunit RPC12/RpoP